MTVLLDHQCRMFGDRSDVGFWSPDVAPSLDGAAEGSRSTSAWPRVRDLAFVQSQKLYWLFMMVFDFQPYGFNFSTWLITWARLTHYDEVVLPMS